MVNLINGDCLEEMKNIPDGSVDAIITDPPYGITACKWDSAIDFDKMWEQLNRVIKKNGAIVLFGSEPFSSALRMSNIKNYKYDWIWIKNIPTGFWNAKKQPMKKHENISIFYNKQVNYNPQMIKRTNYEFKQCYRKNDSKSNVGKSFGSGIKKLIRKTKDEQWLKNPNMDIYFDIEDIRNGTGHPTQKPVKLMEYLIKTYTNENETVLDFTMGSGSTGVACKNTNRKFIGIELDKKYFDIAKERIDNTKNTLLIEKKQKTIMNEYF